MPAFTAAAIGLQPVTSRFKATLSAMIATDPESRLSGASVSGPTAAALPRRRGAALSTAWLPRLAAAEAIGASAELVVVEGAGHSVNLTRPGVVNDAFLRLLERARAAPGTERRAG